MCWLHRPLEEEPNRGVERVGEMEVWVSEVFWIEQNNTKQHYLYSQCPVSKLCQVIIMSTSSFTILVLELSI